MMARHVFGIAAAKRSAWKAYDPILQDTNVPPFPNKSLILGKISKGVMACDIVLTIGGAQGL